MMDMNVLFLCQANMCRSPLAEGIAQEIIKNLDLDIVVDSAGTGSWHVGERPCENSVKVAKNNSIDISNLKARVVTTDDKNEYDYVVCMDKSNLSNLKNQGFKNLYLIGNFGGFGGEDIPDPYYYSGFEGFDLVYNMLNKSIWDFLKTEGLLK
jgi:protein-tyrosine phosphatase